MKPIIKLLIILLAAALCFSSCAKPSPQLDETRDSASVLLTLDASGGETTMIYPQGSKLLGDACKSFSSRAAEETGAKLTRRDDKFPYEGGGSVILVGNVNDHRVSGLCDGLHETEYKIIAADGALAVLGGSEQAVTAALEELFEKYVKDKKIAEIPMDISVNGKYLPPTLNDGAEKTGKNVIVLNTDEKRQTVKYMGASGCWVGKVSEKLSQERLTECMDLLYSETGIDMNSYRYNIGGGEPLSNRGTEIKSTCSLEVGQASGRYSLSNDASAVTVMNMAIERGAEYITLFINSPPAYMTYSGYTCGNTDGSSNLRTECYEAFVAYTVDIVELFLSEGYNVKYVSPINEPSWTWGDPTRVWQEGCFYTVEDIFKIDLMVARELERRGIDTVKVSFPETAAWTAEHYTTTIVDMLKSSPDIIEYIDHFACHSYATSARQKEDFRRQWEQAGLSSIPLHQTEWCSEKTGIEGVIELSRVIHEDLTILECEAWEFWVNMMVDQYSFIIVNDNGYSVNQRMWAMGNYSKFITGATRVELSLDTDEDIFASAYINEEKREIYVVATNASSSAASVELSDFDGLEITAWETSATHNLERVGFVDAAFAYELPAMSVTTFVIGY